MIRFTSLNSAAQEVMMQMFLFGPVWDGNLISKSGRNELVDHGMAFRTDGWQSLTREGLTIAVTADVSHWADRRYYQKQRQLLSQ